ncbi:MAG: ankyrin repeat domain-containing protein [Akkermansia sp.]|nr:ankyrin repeat domain-containing protein [Akkermansia sp.]
MLELDDDEAELHRLLGIAAEYGQLDCLKLLLQTPGVPLNVPSAVDGELSPLQLALPHPACVQALLAVQGIDVGYRNAGGFSALDIAAQLGYADSMQLLLSHPEVLRDFISRTPDISAIDKMYATPECRELLRAAYQQASAQSTPQVTEP